MKKKRKKKNNKPSRRWIVFPGYIPGYETKVIKRPSTIAWVKAANQHVIICYKDGRRETQKVCLKFMKKKLRSPGFFRTGKFYIVNMRMVESYRKYNKGYMFTLKNPTGRKEFEKKIPVSEKCEETMYANLKFFPAITRL